MPWTDISPEQLADELGVDLETIKAKHELIAKIIKARKRSQLTQQDLASMVGKSQSYIAKVERGIGTKNVSFDMLFSLLAALGYKCKITTNKVSEPETIAA